MRQYVAQCSGGNLEVEITCADVSCENKYGWRSFDLDTWEDHSRLTLVRKREAAILVNKWFSYINDII